MSTRAVAHIKKHEDATGSFFDLDFRAHDPTGESERLEDDEILTGATTQVESPMLIPGGSFIPVGAAKIVRTFFENGTPGVTYHVQVRVTTSGSDSKGFGEREMTRVFEVEVVGALI